VTGPETPQPTLRGDRLTLRPLGAEDREPLRALHHDPGVLRWWGPMDPAFPFDSEPGMTRLTIAVDAAPAGVIQFTEELEPAYRSAAIDIFIGDAYAGRGLGREALRLVVDHLVVDRGHHRITIDPAVGNVAAARCYGAAGFEPVGVMRASWRDHESGEWTDSLLMELIRLP
jgi:aminoglycoside 6'-N-acetyltransferase